MGSLYGQPVRARFEITLRMALPTHAPVVTPDPPCTHGPLPRTRGRPNVLHAMSKPAIGNDLEATGLAQSVEPEFAVDGAQLGWSKQGLVGDPHAVERSLKVGAPERQELVELGKAWSQIILLPDELLQDRAVVGHAVENAGRGQAIALQLTSKVARHHRAPPIRAPTLTRTLKGQCSRRAICSVGSVSTLRCCLLTNLLRVGARWPNSRRRGSGAGALGNPGSPPSEIEQIHLEAPMKFRPLHDRVVVRRID